MAYTFTVDFNISRSLGDCSGRLVEVPDVSSNVTGEIVYVYLYGISMEMLEGWTLYQGTANLGVGTQQTLDSSDQVTEETFDFEGDDQKQMSYPIESINYIVANTEILKKDSEDNITVYFSQGDVVSLSEIGKEGFSCIKVQEEGSSVYGTLKVNYNKARYRKVWEWVIPSSSGEYWFFLYEDDDMRYQFKFDLELGEELETSTDITIIVKEYTSDVEVSGATVYVDGDNKGTTDAEGKINLQDVTIGPHTIKVTKAGYLDTDEDDLDNDSFTIEV